MSEILFIRHAETDMAGTFCGHADPELNMRGHVQLEELINKLRAEDIGAVYTSDLRRCHVTGMAVAKEFGVSCLERRGLREISFGQWEGLTWNQIERQNIAYAQRWVAEYPHLPAPGGEYIGDFERRVLNEVKFIFAETENRRRSIAVITHGGVLRTVLRKLFDCSEDEAWNRTRSYCSILRYPIARPFLQSKSNREMQGEYL